MDNSTFNSLERTFPHLVHILRVETYGGEELCVVSEVLVGATVMVEDLAVVQAEALALVVVLL